MNDEVIIDDVVLADYEDIVIHQSAVNATEHSNEELTEYLVNITLQESW